MILSHVPFSQLGLPDLPEKPINEVSEAVMGVTIPFALDWAAVLSGLAVGVHYYKKKDEKAKVDEKAEEPK